MKRKIFIVLLSFILIFSSFAITSIADDGIVISVENAGLDSEGYVYIDIIVKNVPVPTSPLYRHDIIFKLSLNEEIIPTDGWSRDQTEYASEGIGNVIPNDDNSIALTGSTGGEMKIRIKTSGDYKYSELPSIELLKGSRKGATNTYHRDPVNNVGVDDVTVVYSYLNQENPSTLSYTAYLENPSADTVAPGATFTVPIEIKSDESLAAAELNLKATNATIEDVKCELSGEGLISVFTKDTEATGKFTFTGNEESAENGLKVATVTLKAGTEGKAKLAITEGKAAKSTNTGVSDDGTISDGIEITVPKEELSVTVALPFTVTVKDYVSGVTLVKCTTDSDIGNNVPQYDNQPMFKREYTKDNSTVVEYLYLVKGTVDQATAKQKVSLGTAAGISLKDSVLGDLNGSGTVSIVDAQIAYDIAKGNYQDITEQMSATSVDMLHWLVADVNYLDDVDALDARAIQVYLHTGDWNKQIEAA